MGTTTSVSRRLVLVKMKRKPALPKPKPVVPVGNAEVMVDDDLRYSPSAFVARRTPPPVASLPAWQVAGRWAGGLCILVGFVATLIGFAAKFQVPQEAAPIATNSWNSPGYSRSTSGGSSATAGGTGYANRPQSTARGFLSSPFNTRKNGQITCLAPVGANNEAVTDLARCLQQANDSNPDFAGK